MVTPEEFNKLVAERDQLLLQNQTLQARASICFQNSSEILEEITKNTKLIEQLLSKNRKKKFNIRKLQEEINNNKSSVAKLRLRNQQLNQRIIDQSEESTLDLR